MTGHSSRVQNSVTQPYYNVERQREKKLHCRHWAMEERGAHEHVELIEKVDSFVKRFLQSKVSDTLSRYCKKVKVVMLTVDCQPFVEIFSLWQHDRQSQVTGT
jgi:hypothetical protein